MKRFYTFFVICLTLSCWVNVVNAQIAHVPDPNLAEAIRGALDLAPGRPIYKRAMSGLKKLEAEEVNDLTGLEHATQLESLSINGNQIRDLRPLENLTNLTSLDLFGNGQFSDLRPLRNLTNLTSLSLFSFGSTQISDFSPLVDLTSLTFLSLFFADIDNKDLTSIAMLTKLTSLGLGGNKISDVSPLAKLTNLTWLSLFGNKISDVSPLAKLTNLTWLAVRDNPIQDLSPLTRLPKLRDVDVELPVSQVREEGLIPDPNLAAAVRDALGLTPGASIKKQAMQRLTELTAHGSDIRNLAGLEHATQLKALHLGRNEIKDISPLEKLTRLKQLELQSNKITDMSPLANLRSLEVLHIGWNRVTDLSPLTGLIRLVSLNLEANQIREISVIGRLTRLESLNLHQNPISRGRGDLSPLRNLRQLKSLSIRVNQLSDISRHINLSQLESLNLRWSQDIDLRVLGRLSQLKSLNLWDNREIQDITPLSRLTQLESLELGSNKISDVRPLANMTQLKVLGLRGNNIRDVTPLARLVNLEVLRLRDNPIQDASPLAKLTKLREVDIDIPRMSVPTTGTSLAVLKPSGLAPANFTIGPGEFALLVHENQKADTGSADYNTYRLGRTIARNSVNADFPNLAHFFRNGGRIELVSHASLNPLPPDTRESQFADVVISEIMWGLNGSARGKQYIELYNASGDTYTFIDGNLALRFSKGAEESLPAEIFPAPHNPNVELKVIDRVSNVDWKVPGKSGNISKNKSLISMYRTIDYATGNIPDGTLASSWEASNVRVNLPPPSYGTPGAKDLPPTPVVRVRQAQRPEMYWIDAENGTLHRLVGTEVENLAPSVRNATHLAIDVGSEKLYWTEQVGKNRGRVKSANLDGSNVKVLANIKNGVPRNIVVDPRQRKLYWTNSHGRIQRSNLNGKGIRNLIRNLKSPDNITIDVAGGKLYWTEDPGGIRRANLNGKEVEDIASGLSPVSDIAISGNNLYWAERTGESRGSIRRVNLNGSNTTTLARLPLAAMSIAIDAAGRKLYWTDGAGNIRRSNLNGKRIQKVVLGLTAPIDLAVGNFDTRRAAAPTNTSQSLTPDTTSLLTNYPNPFNPETWIPYQLSEPAAVTLHIYTTDGKLIRTLALGHQPAGMYHSKSRAVYWDGKNEVGEPVASGIYFYTLSAGDFFATKKMLIRK